jgi:hypothetical protein
MQNEKPPRKLLDQVSNAIRVKHRVASRCGTTPFAPKRPAKTRSNATFSSTINNTPKIRARTKYSLSSPILPHSNALYNSLYTALYARLNKNRNMLSSGSEVARTARFRCDFFTYLNYFCLPGPFHFVSSSPGPCKFCR